MGITVGMVGLRHPHSLPHLRTFDLCDRVEGLLLCDEDEAALEHAAKDWRKATGIFGSLDDMLARDDMPVVCVAMPNDVTPAVVARCARAGKHVLCEKPCARTAAEFMPAIAELERAGKILGVYYLWRRHPAILRLREWVAAGALGHLTSIEIRMVTTQVRFRDPTHWLFRQEVAGGGILSWLACHWLDVLRFVSGDEVESASALLGTLSGEAISVEDVAAVSLRLRGGALATVHSGYVLSSGQPGYEQPGYDMGIIIRGDRGAARYEWANDEHVATLESSAPSYRSAPRQVHRFVLPSLPAYGGAHGLAFVEEFLAAALDGQGRSPVSAHDALCVLQMLDAIYLSAREERVVHLAASAS